MTQTIHLFIPCLIEQLYPQTARSCVTILEYLGYDVLIPEGQTCCGQPAYNSGYTRESGDLAAHWLDVFKEAEYVVAPSGSCISMVRNHYGDLALNSATEIIYRRLKNHIYELTEFIGAYHANIQFPSVFKGKVTYHESCHLSRELGIKSQPRDILKQIPGVEFIEMADADRCCGFGGTFIAKFAELSATMTRFKAERIIASGAEYVTAADAGCLMTIQSMLSQLKSPVKAIHIAEIIAEGLL